MSFIEKTLYEIASFMEISALSSDFSKLNGYLQNVNSKLKIAGIFLLILLVNLSKNISQLLFLSFFIILLACLSKINPLFFLKRTLFFVSLFALVLVIPAVFSFVTPGECVVEVANFHTEYLKSLNNICITKQGLISALLLFFRITLSASLGILAVLTTKWTDIVASLRAFYVPNIAVLTMLISYRYIFVLIKTAENALFAQKSRTFNEKNYEYSWISNRIGMLVKKSFELGDNVYLAVESRGFSQAESITSTQGIKTYNYLWIILIAACITLYVGYAYV